MFLNEGHKKDNSIQNQNINNALSRLDVQSSDQHMLFIAQKSEKITVALYMITDFLKDKEPFKWQIREKAIQFLSFINSFKGLTLASQKERAISEMLPLLSELLALLRFAVSTRFISQMNYSILRDEYASLHETLEDRLKMRQPVDGLVLPQDFFELKNEEKSLAPSDERQGHHKNDLSGADVKENDTDNTKNTDRKISLNKNINIAVNVAPYGVDHIDSIDSKKGMRQDIILKLLRTRGGVSIKDISEIISGCSEKTIQRELISLIGKGFVRKIGERRWSKYALV